MYSKKEVVELLKDFKYKNLLSRRFDETFTKLLKEKGLIESELEIGKWYHYGTDLLVWNGGDSTYGFNQGVDYLNNAYFTVDEAIPATDKEVEEALIKEAKKRGFKEGVKVTQINKYNLGNPGEDKWVVTNGHYEYICGKLFICNICLFNDGKWAEIIEEESYSHTLTYGDVNDTNVADIGNEITVNGITYTKKYRHC